ANVLLVRLLLCGSNLTSTHFFFFMFPRPPTSTLFPYTTLFRSIFEAGQHVARFFVKTLHHRIAAVIADFFAVRGAVRFAIASARSEEHTSELQSRENLVCRLLLEKKKKKKRH